jgi:hypothetical protein
LIAPAYGPTLKASPAQQTDRAAQKPAPATGELFNVDPVAKTLSIKMAGGAEMLFSYNDQTVVTGGEKSVAGLATMSGAPVTVTYRVDGTNNIATNIEVRQKT